MIDTEDIIRTLGNCKFKKIQLPTSAKFTQFDCYEAKRREMELLVSGLESLNAMTDIGTALESDTILADLAQQYGECALKQSEAGTMVGAEKISTATIDWDTYLNYQENELIPAPPIIKEVTAGVLATDRVFIYGLKNPESFYKAVLVASRADFISKTKQNRVSELFTFKREISVSAKDRQHSAEYQKLAGAGFDPNTISANLIDKETYVDDPLAQATADFLGKSLVIFDLVGRSFKTYRSAFWKSEQLGESYFLVFYEGAYSPLIHVDSRNIINGDQLISRLAGQYEHTNPDLYKTRDEPAKPNSSFKLRSALNTPYFDPAKLVTKSELLFDDIQAKLIQHADAVSAAKTIANQQKQQQQQQANLKSAKLAELQTIAAELGIAVSVQLEEGKTKRKTREQLITEITAARAATPEATTPAQ